MTPEELVKLAEYAVAHESAYYGSAVMFAREVVRLSAQLAAQDAARGEIIEGCPHEFHDYVVCRNCGRTEAAIEGCHHCDEGEPGALCFWCLQRVKMAPPTQTGAPGGEP